MTTYHMPAPVDRLVLRQALIEAGFRRREAAKAIGITKDYLDKILSGQRTLQPSNRRQIGRICAVLTERTGIEFLPADLAIVLT